MTVVAGIVAGGVLYLITAFLGELIDHSVKTSKELRSLFDYTLLGMIPNTRKKSILSTSRTENVLPERQVLEDPNSVPSEAYRMLQANLKFLSPDEDLKVIAVTSSVPKEGKSTVSTNLATAIAQLGNKVLLIDADLHQPQQHHIWQLTNQSGLSNVVVNNASLEDSIRSVIPNLDVLPSGSIPPQPLALLESQRLNSLMQQFKQDYDFVILDTPPLLLLADTLTVSKTADGILLVARPGVTTRVSATAARETLQKSGQRILGLVANGIAVEDEPDSSFYYARDYRKNKNTSNPLPNFLAPR